MYSSMIISLDSAVYWISSDLSLIYWFDWLACCKKFSQLGQRRNFNERNESKLNAYAISFAADLKETADKEST